MVRAFYRDIRANFDGQIIIMENTDPLDPLGVEARDIRFTKHVDVGRYGFLPVVDGEETSGTLALEG